MHVEFHFGHFLVSEQSHGVYCKTLNVCVPFISQISCAKQNREIKGREYQLQAKNRTKLLQYFELYGFNSRKYIRGQKILHAKSPTFRAAKLKGFTVIALSAGKSSTPN